MATDLVSPKPYVKWSVIALVVTMTWCVLILPVTAYMSERAPMNDVLVAVVVVFVGLLLPGGAMIGAYLRVEGWQSLTGKKIAKWQGETTRALIVVFCIVCVAALTHAFWFADFTESMTDGKGLVLNARPYEKSLIARVQFVCTLSAWLLPFALSFGLFAKEPTKD